MIESGPLWNQIFTLLTGKVAGFTFFSIFPKSLPLERRVNKNEPKQHSCKLQENYLSFKVFAVAIEKPTSIQKACPAYPYTYTALEMPINILHSPSCLN